MRFCETELSGCFELVSPVHFDNRGIFQKIFNKTTFGKLHLVCNFAESYYSVSKKNVVRGMHFQMPPCDHGKLVTCLMGSIIDVVLDLRVKSRTFGLVYSAELNDENRKAIYIPRGCAHGFLTTSEKAMTMYYVTSEYNANCDTGIRWDSIDFSWNVDKPIISERDAKFELFENFVSPF